MIYTLCSCTDDISNDKTCNEKGRALATTLVDTGDDSYRAVCDSLVCCSLAFRLNGTTAAEFRAAWTREDNRGCSAA